MSFLLKYANSSPTSSGKRIALGKGRFALVDNEDFDYLNQFRWHCKMSNCCWYAVRKKWVNGSCFYIRMHREVMHTPKGQECHHVYCNTLDNRKAFLQNVTPEEHHEAHRTKNF